MTPTAMQLHPVYSVRFVSSADGKQSATVRLIQGERAAGVGEDGKIIVQKAPVSVGREALVTRAGDCHFFFDWRSDPFFFDANGFFNKMQSSLATIFSPTRMFAAS